MANQSNPFLAPAPKTPDVIAVDFDHDDDAPSRASLLQRAAELGPRLTYATFRNSFDPIIGAKMQPRVIERRARFRKIVKAALGGCVAFCMIATVATAFSSTSSPTASAARTGHSVASTPVEKLEVSEHTKAPSRVVAAQRPAKFMKRR